MNCIRMGTTFGSILIICSLQSDKTTDMKHSVQSLRFPSLLVALLMAASAHTADYNWENLSSWTATVADRPYSFVLSPDGTKLYLSMQSCSIVFFR